MSVRVRFAPSPTGHLHIGGARTALFNWLYARHTGGKFILRIEDTDVARNTQEATEMILEGLRWLGLGWDEGPLTGEATGPSTGDRGPYFQSQRRENYLRRVEALLSRDMAYERDGAIRFRMRREPIVFHDLIVGEVRRELTDREAEDPDFVIVRSDGKPVFHLTNVADDLEMGVTHVIRGEDHLSNTPKHIALFEAFGVQPPKYAHIPLILNADGTKMSKRDRGASLKMYMEEGYAPEALVNYLVLLGWSPKEDRQFFSLDELIERFDLSEVLRHNARFDLAKLQWMNGQYLSRMEEDRFVELGVHAFARAGLDPGRYPPGYVKAALRTCRNKIKTFGELPEYAGFYFKERLDYDPEAEEKFFTPENRELLERLRETYANLDEWTPGYLEAQLKNLAGLLNIKPAALVHPLRLACTGRRVGPSLYHLMEVLGKETVLRRIDEALARIPPQTPTA
ncbi:MAG: glutamate--tRNA ligase [Verrucomicrobia bacterium]|nr:glutamate--tRNA ligase [Verrucomicrobiota bacterium]